MTTRTTKAPPPIKAKPLTPSGGGVIDRGRQEKLENRTGTSKVAGKPKTNGSKAVATKKTGSR